MRTHRYFCYGSIFTSAIWGFIIMLYLHVQEKPTGHIAVQKPHVKLQPRHDVAPLHHPNDVIFNANDINQEMEMKKSPVLGQDASQFQGDPNMMGVIRNPEDQRIRDEGYKLYAFNQLISDRLGFHRALPDNRHRLCKEKVYPGHLPSASIVICFYNEAWSTLLRTVHSVLDRSPERYIHEIILVDDNSELVHLGADLDQYIADNLPKVKMVRASERQGLIRARILGADHATGEVLVFLDSHCEVTQDWLQPLLAQVQEGRSNVAIPIIDIIDHDTFQYQSSPMVRGGFNWGLHYRWDQLPQNYFKTKQDYVKPIKSPTMAGGLFAINRLYFIEIGKYDPGMDVWGGENLEISFRVWQCGGRLDILPCSRVGHVFRKRRPYGSPGGDSMTTTH